MADADDNKIGVVAFWDNENWLKGWGEYVKGLVKATNVTEESAEVMEGSMVPAIGKTGNAFMTTAKKVFAGVVAFVADTAAKVADTVATIALTVAATALTIVLAALVVVAVAIVAAILLVAGAFAALTAVAGLAAAGMKKVVDWMFVGADSAMMMASSLKELNTTAQVLGQQAGVSGDKIAEMVKELQSLGLTAKEANKTIIEMLRNNLDLAWATDIARVAQDASIITSKSLEDTIEGLTKGIAQGSEEMLRSSGITIDTTAANETYAVSLGKDVKELTQAEEQQATYNAVMVQATRIQGAYAASLETGTAQLRQYSDNVETLKVAMGAPFQQAFYNVSKGMNLIVENIIKMVSEGGVLYPLLVDIGAVFAIITEPILRFGETLGGISDAGGPIDRAVQGLMTFVSNAFDWGVNLVTNFAVGMIRAAETVLLMAINYIGNILTGWFSPGSPPKILPDIDDWGKDLISEWLHGMTRADFGVLNSIQGPLKAALDFSETIGLLGKGEAQQWFADISAGLLQVLQGKGDINKVFADMMSGAGQFGKEIVELTKMELELVAATDKIAVAQDKLTEAMKRYSQAGAKVNKGLIEYNQMLRGGATKEELALKLKQINADRDAQKQAAKDIIAADKELYLAEQRKKALEEQIALQKELLRVMMELWKAALPPKETAPKEPPKGGGGGKGEVGVPGVGGPGAGFGFEPGKLFDQMGLDISAAMERIKTRISDAWNGIKMEVLNALVTMQRNVREALNDMELQMEKNARAIGDWGEEGAAKIGTFVTETSAKIGQWVTDRYADIGKWTTDNTAEFGTWYTETGAKIGNWVTETGAKIGTWVTEHGQGKLGAWITKNTAEWGTWLTTTYAKIGKWVTDTGVKLGQFQTEGGAKIGTFITDAGAALGTFYTNSGLEWGKFWDGVAEAIDTAFNNTDKGILPMLKGFVDDMELAGAQLIAGMIKGVLGAIGGLIDAVSKAVGDAIGAGKGKLKEKSPSLVFAEIGAGTMKGMELGIEHTAKLPKQATEAAMVGVTKAATSIPIMTGNTSYYQPNIRVSANINTPMNVPQLEALIMRTVKKGMR